MSPEGVRRFDRATLVAIGLGILLMLQPLWSCGLRLGFFGTLAAVLLQTVAGHLPREGR